jgi:hypothetical protein
MSCLTAVGLAAAAIGAFRETPHMNTKTVLLRWLSLLGLSLLGPATKPS